MTDFASRLDGDEVARFNLGGQWLLYNDVMSKWYTKSETTHFKHSDVSDGTGLLTKWTQKGRLMINTLLNNREIFANMDKENNND